MNFTLRKYQNEFKENIRQAFRTNKSVLAQLPTGGGKTKVFISITQAALEKERPVLILTESKKIFSQIQNEVGGIELNAGCSDAIKIEKGMAYVAMAQTLNKRPMILRQFNNFKNELLVITDEAHMGTHSKILFEIPSAKLIGFTATPVWRTSKHLPLIYQTLVTGPQVQELIQEQALVPYRHYARVGIRHDFLKIQNGEYTEKSQMLAFYNQDVFNGLYEDLNKIPYKKCLIFCSSIDHCDLLHKDLCEAGFKVSKTHSIDSALMKEFDTENSGINICVSVGQLTKGYDYPVVDLIVLNRATTSLALFLQMLGRGSRPSDMKQSFTALDYGSNWQKHGLWDWDRDWNKLWKAPKKGDKPLGAPPVKNCPSCMAIIAASARVCPYCSFELPLTEKQKKDGLLVELTEKYQSLIGKKLSELNAEELALYARLKNKGQFAMRIARSQEQKREGWLRDFAKSMGYKNGWIDHQIQLITSEPIEFNDFKLK